MSTENALSTMLKSKKKRPAIRVLAENAFCDVVYTQSARYAYRVDSRLFGFSKYTPHKVMPQH